MRASTFRTRKHQHDRTLRYARREREETRSGRMALAASAGITQTKAFRPYRVVRIFQLDQFVVHACLFFNAASSERKSCEPEFTRHGRSVRRSRDPPKPTHCRVIAKSGQVDLPTGMATCPLLIEIVIASRHGIGCRCDTTPVEYAITQQRKAGGI